VTSATNQHAHTLYAWNRNDNKTTNKDYK